MKRRQVHEDLEDRPAQDGEFLVVRGHGPVHHPEVLGGGVQAQELPHGEYRFGGGRVDLLAEGHEDRLAAVGPLHAQADAASGLDATEVVATGRRTPGRPAARADRRRSGCGSR